MRPPPIIEFKNVVKRFNGLTVLNGINLSIYQGEITAIIGKSGTGKSVLLKHIIGLMESDSGTILISGNPLSEMGRDEKRRFRRELSYMFQENALFDSLNIFDNIALPLVENRHYPKPEIRQKVQTRMKQLNIEGIDHKFPSELSGGMKKRVALARALVTDPNMVLFDEPTTGLDPIRKRNVHHMIQSYQKQFGFTAVIVSHDIPDIFDIAQHIAMLDNGVIEFEGTKDDVFSSRNPLVKSFIQDVDQVKK